MRSKNSRGNDNKQRSRRAEGVRRHAAIQALIEHHDGPLRAVDRHDVTKKLGLSQTTLYRLIAAYKAHGTVEALTPRAAGRPRGLSPTNDQAREDIIARCIREVYLAPDKPPMKRLVDEIHARCAQAEVPPPDWRTIRARVRAVRRTDATAVKAAMPGPGDRVAIPSVETVQTDPSQVNVIIVEEEIHQPG